VFGDEVLEIRAQRVALLGRLSKGPKLPGHADRAASALAIAAADDRDLLVYVKDVEREPGAKRSDHERKRKMASLHTEIEAGFARVADADHVRRAQGTPCRMIEAWALGDANALPKSADKRERSEPVPAQPELLWGAEQDPSSNHPKCVLQRVLGREASAAIFEEIATEADMRVVSKTCPESFKPFAAELNAARDELLD